MLPQQTVKEQTRTLYSIVISLGYCTTWIILKRQSQLRFVRFSSGQVLFSVTFCVTSWNVLAIICLWALLRLVRILTRVTVSEPGTQWTDFSYDRMKSGCSISWTVFSSTFPLQRRLDLHGILVWVEIGEGSHCSKGAPRHFLLNPPNKRKITVCIEKNVKKMSGRTCNKMGQRGEFRQTWRCCNAVFSADESKEWQIFLPAELRRALFGLSAENHKPHTSFWALHWSDSTNSSWLLNKTSQDDVRAFQSAW